jgi:hypothetical protein
LGADFGTAGDGTRCESTISQASCWRLAKARPPKERPSGPRAGDFWMEKRFDVLPRAPPSVFRGSRKFHPVLSEPKPCRPISVVRGYLCVCAALFSLPAVSFCVFSCHVLSCVDAPVRSSQRSAKGIGAEIAGAGSTHDAHQGLPAASMILAATRRRPTPRAASSSSATVRDGRSFPAISTPR